jgi:hypothetical protein
MLKIVNKLRNNDNYKGTTLTRDKYKMDLTTNSVVITDAIKFVQTNKKNLMSKEDDK